MVITRLGLSSALARRAFLRLSGVMLLSLAAAGCSVGGGGGLGFGSQGGGQLTGADRIQAA